MEFCIYQLNNNCVDILDYRETEKSVWLKNLFRWNIKNIKSHFNCYSHVKHLEVKCLCTAHRREPLV